MRFVCLLVSQIEKNYPETIFSVEQLRPLPGTHTCFAVPGKFTL